MRLYSAYFEALNVVLLLGWLFHSPIHPLRHPTAERG
jgi:hypothetical protein